MVLLTTVADLDIGDLSDAYSAIRERRMRSEERWGKLGNVGLITASIFAAATLHGLWTGDDLAGLVMTIVPGVATLGFWAYARLRVSQIVEGHNPSVVQRVISWGLVAAAIAVVAFAPRTESRREDRADAQQPIYLGNDLEVGYLQRADGTRIRSLVRKNEKTRADCPDDWREIAHPTEKGETVGYCAPSRKPAPPR